MRAIALTVILLLASCAVDGNPASHVASDGGTLRLSDGKTYTRVTDCTSPLAGDAKFDPAYEFPPDRMAPAMWQQIIENMYAAERKLDQACLDGRFYFTLTGKVTRYKILDPG